MLEDRAEGRGSDVSMGGKRRGEVSGGAVKNVGAPAAVLCWFWFCSCFGMNPINLASSAIDRFHNKSRVHALADEEP